MNLTSHQVLEAMPRWWPSLVRWAVAFTLKGPWWMPIELRKVPLRLCALFLESKAVGVGAACGRGEAPTGAGAKRREGMQSPEDVRGSIQGDA